MAIIESAEFDLFNPRSQMKLFESGAFFEGAVSDDFDGVRNLDALEGSALVEGFFFDLFNPRSQMKLFEFGACVEGVLADDFDGVWNLDRGDQSIPHESEHGNLDDGDSVNKARNLDRALKSFVAPGYADAFFRDLPLKKPIFRRFEARGVVDEEFDVFVERVGRESFKG